MRHIESQIQKDCVTWFRLQYPKIGRLLFAVPNGGEERKGSRDYEGRRSNGRGCRPYPTLPFRRVSFPLYRV